MGEKNKFYYDENLKRWVEEGAETPSKEATLLPPPTSAAFQSKMPDYTPKDGPEIDNVHYNSEQEHKNPYSLEQNSGIPPIPPSSNHFAARGHMGVCARYNQHEVSLVSIFFLSFFSFLFFDQPSCFALIVCRLN